MRSARRFAAVAVLFGLAVAARPWAQTGTPPPPQGRGGGRGTFPAQQRPPGAVGSRSDATMQARHEIFVMERVLEQKVQYGALRLNERLRAAGMPEMALLAGAARARGTRLEGYGVYFDLEVPAVRQSVSLLMSLRSMNRPDPEMAETVRALRNMAQRT